MAFVTHPFPTTHTHHTHSNLPSFPPHASPKFLSSRRRHVIQFLHQPNPPNNSSPDKSASHSNLSQRRADAIKALMQRRAARQSAIAADAVQKAQLWADTLAQLKTPPAPSVADNTSPPQDQLEISISRYDDLPSAVAPPAQDTPQEPAVDSGHSSSIERGVGLIASDVDQAPSDRDQPTPDVEKSTRSSVADLYAPPSDTQSPATGDTAEGVPRPSVDFSAAAEKIRDAIGAAGSAAQLALGKLSDDDKIQAKQDDIVADMFKGISEQIKDELDLVQKGVTEEEAKALNNKLGDLWPAGVQKVEDFAQNVAQDVEEAVDKAEETVEDLVEGAVDKVKETAEELVQAAEDIVEPTVDSVNRDGEDEKEEKANDVANEHDRKTLGEKILNAIVDGVEHPEQPVTPADEDPVDKAYVVDLVASGKIKSLTVTKLRRLLSANSLKTSGRKSELIARLTSFAKAK
eukprot:GFKZ01011036.1.p1 GENE.GFKZ01011036.1~~GFKZ01011036.1.p1  ORF type:complete len:461 (-),score=98.83 GFKZ01011036.1:2632-4014(-)